MTSSDTTLGIDPGQATVDAQNTARKAWTRPNTTIAIIAQAAYR